MRIPDEPPTRSRNAFFVEMGFDPGIWGLDRMQAIALEAPTLRVVSQVKAGARELGYRNYVIYIIYRSIYICLYPYVLWISYPVGV